MKTKLFTLGLVAGLMISPAWALKDNVFTGGGTSGEPCAYTFENTLDYGDPVGHIVSCHCPGTHSSRITAVCAKDEEVPSGGCLADGQGSSDDRYYCVIDDNFDMYATACTFCGCNDSGNTVSDWLTSSGNRVYKNTTTISVTETAHRCSEDSRTTTVSDWGCDANYYKSAGSGSTMTCSPCPEHTTASGAKIRGNSPKGETSISSCTISKSTQTLDDKGSYTCGADYIGI